MGLGFNAGPFREIAVGRRTWRDGNHRAAKTGNPLQVRELGSHNSVASINR